MSWTGVITNAGRALLAQQIAASKAVIIDEVQCGSGVSNSMITATALTTVVSTSEGKISSNASSGELVKLGVQVGPHNGDSYTLREIGIFAYDHNKSASSRALLILLNNADGVSVPQASTFPDFLYSLQVAMPVSNASSITVNISQSAVVDAQDFAAAIAKLTEGPDSSTANHVALFDGTTGKKLKDSGKTLPVVMTGATASKAGKSGLVPIPAAGAQNKFLRGDGTWEDVPDPQTMTGATASAAGTGGLVPVPAAGSQGKYLKGDGTWANVPNPQVMTGATASAAGTSGLVPAPAAGANEKFLKGDGTWAIPLAISAGNNITITPTESGATISAADVLLMPSAPINIPSSGASASYNMAGLTANHRVLAWNFSDSAENSPPCNLTITTYAGYFTITNNGGTTGETVCPMFAVAKTVVLTNRS